MPNSRSNIDYIQLCKALEEGDQMAAQNLILQDVNIDTFNLTDRYNWANIIYEILEVSAIIKAFEAEDKVTTYLLLRDTLLPHVVNRSELQRAAESCFRALNVFRRYIRSSTIEKDGITIQSLGLTEYDQNLENKRNNTNDPCTWADSIIEMMNLFGELFCIEAFEEDRNASEFHKWTSIISKILDINIGLFTNKANIHASNHDNYELLNVAIQKSNMLEVCLFIRRGALLGGDFIVLLLGAIEQNNDTIAKILIDHVMQYNPSINLIIPLHVTILKKQLKIVDYIVPLTSCLKSSEQCNDTQILLSIEEEAKIHLQTPGNSYTYVAIKNRYRKIAKFLLNYNPDVQYISPDGDTVLHKAIENDFNAKFIETLIKLNSPVNAVNHTKVTPLHVACKTKSANQLKIIKTLLRYNANINCSDNDLTTPLHLACQTHNLEVVKVLLKKGANPNARNSRNQTPLHVVCGFKNTSLYYNINISSIIHLLLKHKADIDAVDSRGWTPFFEACNIYHEEAVRSLVNSGANINHRDLEKLNPFYIAVQNCSFDRTEIVELLLKYKVNVSCVNKLGKSIIHLIVENNAGTLIERFADTKVNFNAIDNQGNTPLHIAIDKQSPVTIVNLLRCGADLNILDAKGRTPLKKAIGYVYHREKLNDSDWCESNHNTSYKLSRALLLLPHNRGVHLSKNIVTLLIRHIVTLKTAGLKISSQNLNLFNTFTNNFEYFNRVQHEVECVQEIEKMKTEQCGVNSITFHDLLMKNIHFLTRFVRNEQIQKTLDSKIYNKKFSLYIDIVRSRFRDAKMRSGLLYMARRYFNLRVSRRLPDDCINAMFSYLQVEDINMFIQAAKRLKTK